jgi:septal ring-binding cell division protein DamX
MPHRRLVKIGEPPKLPTISQFLMDMAQKQHEEIQRLKTEAATGVLPDPTVPEEHHEELTPDPWQLHPVRIKKPAKKKAAKKPGAKKFAKSPAKAKKVVKAKKAASKPVSRKKAAKKAGARKSKR